LCDNERSDCTNQRRFLGLVDTFVRTAA
jgi:hypothetical protein